MEERNSGRHEFLRGFLWGLAVMLALAALLVLILRTNGTLTLNRNQDGSSRSAVLSGDTEGKLGELADIMDEYYYQDVDSASLQESVYAGLLDGLGDPYSVYYTVDEYKSLNETTSGIYTGIGVVLTQNRDTMVVKVLHVYPNSPAEEAGVQDGDTLVSVGGIEGSSLELSKLVQQIKGEEGSSVSLVVSREGGKKDLEFTVERRQIQVPTVEYQMLDGETGLIQITEFSEVTAEQFQTAAEDLSSQGMVSMIVDLRDNPGGLVSSVCAILDEILPEGVLVYTQDKNGERKDYVSNEEHMKLPIIVLINENSASASEIFAGAIKDFQYGTLIGTTSFGKGIVQQIIPLEDGSAVKITTAKYYTPSGKNIHEVGIDPDIKLEYKYLNEEDKEYDPMHDNQVLKALETFQTR